MGFTAWASRHGLHDMGFTAWASQHGSHAGFSAACARACPEVSSWVSLHASEEPRTSGPMLDCRTARNCFSMPAGTSARTISIKVKGCGRPPRRVQLSGRKATSPAREDVMKVKGRIRLGASVACASALLLVLGFSATSRVGAADAEDSFALGFSGPASIQGPPGEAAQGLGYCTLTHSGTGPRAGRSASSRRTRT